MTEEEIQLLIEMDEDIWASYLPYLSAQMKQQITLGAFTGLSEVEILENISRAVLSEAQVETLLATSLMNYSRSINYLQMIDAPNNTLYQYVGPIDAKTRDICLKQGSSGFLTKDEIIKSFGSDVLVYAGGYNCRHSWEEVSDIGIMKELYNPEKAKKLLVEND